MANSYTSSSAHAHISTCTNPSICAAEIYHDSSYPMLDRIVSKSIDVFKIDCTILHMLGART